jgi:hypothetical protein
MQKASERWSELVSSLVLRLTVSASWHQELADTVKIHEYQAKAIFARHGVPVPRGEVAVNPHEAGEIAGRLGGGCVVVKAQIQAGGQGKGGGGSLRNRSTKPKRSRGR